MKKQFTASSQSQTANSQSTTNSNNQNQFQKSIQDLEILLQKASSLEKKLNITVSSSTTTTTTSKSQYNKTQQKSNQIRTELCEKYSDILLSNPQFAYRKDIPNKLWRICFYSKIDELRNRIAKDKYRLKKNILKQQQSALDGNGSSGGSGSGGEDVIAQQEKHIIASQKALDIFLHEAVRLYEFLVDRLQDMLIEFVDCKNEEEGEDDGPDDDDDESITDDDDDEEAEIEMNEFDRNYQSQSQQSSKNRNKSKSITSKSKKKNTKMNKHKSTQPSSSQEQKQQQQQQQETTKIVMFVVPTLFRIYIHLGDLHRYSSSYSAAEKAYLKASNLAPGKGNPYNQLAVCNQINETRATTSGSKSATGHPLPAIALYWYCRSLLASHEAFITSKANLERLFQANKKWIQESNVKTFADVAKTQQQQQNAKDKTEETGQAYRAKRSLAKRKFLSKYVDFHGSLLSLMTTLENKNDNSDHEMKKNKESSKPTKSKTDTATDTHSMKVDNTLLKNLIHDVDNLMKDLESNVEISAFGDAFVIKMVCINVFSVWNGLEYLTKAMNGKDVGGEEKSSSESSNKLMMTVLQPVIIPLMFALRFGTLLCKDLEKNIEKGIAKHQNQGEKTFRGIHRVGPVFLICDFVSNECKLKELSENLHSLSTKGNYLVDESTAATTTLPELFDATIQNFWRSVADVANVISGSESLMTLIDSDMDDSYALLPYDFQSLVRGYVPFVSIGKNNNKNQNSNADDKKEEGNQVYLSPKEAFDVLDLYQSSTQTQQSQSSKKSSTNCGNDSRTPEKIEMELRVKLKRFMTFVSNHINGGQLIKSRNGVVSILEDVESMESNAAEDDDGIGMDIDKEEDMFLNETQDDRSGRKDDVLVYTTAESGQPALLVPTAFLREEEDEEEKVAGGNVKEFSFLSEVTMTGGLEERTSGSVPNLLDPSLLVEKSRHSDKGRSQGKVIQPDIGESKLLGLVHKNLSSSAPDLGLLPTPISENPAQKTAIRPPPGFNTMQKPAVLPMPGGLHSQPPQVHNSFPLPQTANPFVPVPPMGLNSNIGFNNDLQFHNQSKSNGLHGSNNLNANMFSDFAKSNANVMIENNHDDSEDMNFDYDVLGLHTLGIFTDDQNDNENTNLFVDSLFQPMAAKTKTRNPFVFD